MFQGIKKGAGSLLSLFQSYKLWRVIGKRIFRDISISEASSEDMNTVQMCLNPGNSPRPTELNPLVTNLIATWRGHILGFVQLVRHPPSHAPYVGYWLFSLTIFHPLCRGLGIGERLCHAILDHARREGAEEILLIVRQNNRPAVALYQKLGFSQTSLEGLEEKLIQEAETTGKRRITMVKRFS
ncbi:GNAT family N-acetyltransferase [Methanospirillum sp.]